MSRTPWNDRIRTLGLLLACAVVLVLSLRLRAAEDDLRAALLRSGTLTVGSYVPAVAVPSAAGDSIRLPGGERAHVLLFLTTTCGYCQESVPAWKELIRRAAALPDVGITLVSLDSLEATRAFLESHGLETPTAVFTDPRHRSFYRTGGVPQTAVVDRNARVVYSRPELFTFSAIDSVLSVLQRVRISSNSARAPQGDRIP